MLYRLSRHSRLHNLLRKIGYAVLWRLPEAPLYAVGTGLRRRRLPYRLLHAGATVVQLGAPWDTLKAGRSRAIHFARLVGPSGRVIVLEPDAESVAALRAFTARHRLDNVTIIAKGAWSKAGTIDFLRDPRHPAANLVEAFYADERSDRHQFERTTISVDRLDSTLSAAGIDRVDLLSITTNGSENDILEGVTNYRGRICYVSTIGALSQYPALARLGFVKFGDDDRGITFVDPLAVADRAEGGA